MKKLPWRVERKKEILKQYQRLLNDTTHLEFFDQDLTCTTPWFIETLVDDRENLISFLKEKGIGTRTMYPPINKQVAYTNIYGNPNDSNYPISNLVGKKGLWLPSASQLTDDNIIYITNQIKQFYSSYNG